jgi:hypothetical protein
VSSPDLGTRPAFDDGARKAQLTSGSNCARFFDDSSVPRATTWKCRFIWLRDAFFTATAPRRLSATRATERCVRFIVDMVEAGSSRGEIQEIAARFPIAPGTGMAGRL